MSTDLDTLIAQKREEIATKQNSTESGVCSLANVNADLAVLNNELTGLLTQKATTEAPFTDVVFSLQFALGTNLPSLQSNNKALADVIIASGKTPAAIPMDGVEVRASGTLVTLTAIGVTDPLLAAKTLDIFINTKGAKVDITRAMQSAVNNDTQSAKMLQSNSQISEVFATLGDSFDDSTQRVALTTGNVTYDGYAVAIPVTYTEDAVIQVNWNDNGPVETLTKGATSAIHTYLTDGDRIVMFTGSKPGLISRVQAANISVPVVSSSQQSGANKIPGTLMAPTLECSGKINADNSIEVTATVGGTLPITVEIGWTNPEAVASEYAVDITRDEDRTFVHTIMDADPEKDITILAMNSIDQVVKTVTLA